MLKEYSISIFRNKHTLEKCSQVRWDGNGMSLDSDLMNEITQFLTNCMHEYPNLLSGTIQVWLSSPSMIDTKMTEIQIVLFRNPMTQFVRKFKIPSQNYFVVLNTLKNLSIEISHFITELQLTSH